MILHCYNFACLCNLDNFCRSLHIDLTPEISTDGGSRGTEHLGHNLRQEKQNPSLLFVMAEQQNL